MAGALPPRDDPGGARLAGERAAARFALRGVDLVKDLEAGADRPGLRRHFIRAAAAMLAQPTRTPGTMIIAAENSIVPPSTARSS